jgi:hypothetical protein
MRGMAEYIDGEKLGITIIEDVTYEEWKMPH